MSILGGVNFEFSRGAINAIAMPVRYLVNAFDCLLAD